MLIHRQLLAFHRPGIPLPTIIGVSLEFPQDRNRLLSLSSVRFERVTPVRSSDSSLEIYKEREVKRTRTDLSPFNRMMDNLDNSNLSGKNRRDNR